MEFEQETTEETEIVRVLMLRFFVGRTKKTKRLPEHPAYSATSKVARRMVAPTHREGGQSQYAAAANKPTVLSTEDEDFGPVLDWMTSNLTEPFTFNGSTKPGRFWRRRIFPSSKLQIVLPWIGCKSPQTFQAGIRDNAASLPFCFQFNLGHDMLIAEIGEWFAQ